jgi:DNA gyrase subunit B
MPELVENGHIYIAQPPLYKVKLGKEEQYLKDSTELDAYLLRVALKDAKLETGVPGGAVLQGDALEALARQYVLANNVANRLSAWMDVEGLRAMANGLELNLDTLEAAEKSATGLKAALHDAEVSAEFDTRSDKHILRISRMQHGNVKRGEGERQKESRIADFRQAMAWLIQQAEAAVGRQRYKGLGEMNPIQLWETTMDPAVRRLLKVQIDDAIEADRVFTMLMGDEVEPRRNFIETNALRASNIDV